LMHPRVPENLHAYPEDGHFGEIQVVPTPGHTRCHVCLLYREVLFAGDLVVTGGGKVKPSPVFMTWNTPVLMASIEKIKTYPFRWICPAHGRPLERGDLM